MDPTEFAWTEDQQVTVLNPTADPFTWKVHGKEYRLDAGKTAKMPGFIAWLYVYNQAVKAVNEEDAFTRWNEEGFRQGYYDRFVAGVDDLVQVIEEDEPEVTTFDDGETVTPGTGSTYEPKAVKRGSPNRS